MLLFILQVVYGSVNSFRTKFNERMIFYADPKETEHNQ